MTELEKLASELGIKNGCQADFSCWSHREAITKTHGFSIPTEKAMDMLNLHNPLLEVGAGTGYWAYEMRKRNIDVVATDISPEPLSTAYKFEKIWTNVESLSALDAIRKYPDRTLFVSWPTLGDHWMAEALKEYTGSYFIFVGEDSGGCTAEDTFFELLEKEWTEKENISILQWPGIHDYMGIFQRKLLMEVLQPRKVQWK